MSFTDWYTNFYALPEEAKLINNHLPYIPNRLGLGVSLVDQVAPHQVLVNDAQDRVRFNEKKNLYAVKLIGLIMKQMRLTKNMATTPDKNKDKDDARKINRVGERKSFDIVLKKEAESLATEAGYAPEELTNRRLNVIWKIMTGFNSEDPFNAELDKILGIYAKIRLGHTPYFFDEVEAALKAVQLYYLEVCKDNKTQGQGAWCLPVLHLLNGHMILRGLNPITFHPNVDKDEELRVNLRAKHNTSIWITSDEDDTGKVCCQVETRQDVIDKLVNFLIEILKTEGIAGVREDEGLPEATQTETEPATKKVRRSLNLG